MMLNFFKSKVFNIFFISYSLIILSISFMLYEHTNVVVVSLKKGNIEIPNVNKFNPQKDKNTIVNVNEYFKFLYEKKFRDLDFSKHTNEIFEVNLTVDNYNKTYIFKINYKNKISDTDKLKLNKFVKENLNLLIKENLEEFNKYNTNIYRINAGNLQNLDILMNTICNFHNHRCNNIKLFIRTNDHTVRKDQARILLSDQDLEYIFIDAFKHSLINYFYARTGEEENELDKINIINYLGIDVAIKDYSKINKIIFISFVIFLLGIPFFVRQLLISS